MNFRVLNQIVKSAAPLQVYPNAALFNRQQDNGWTYDKSLIASILGRTTLGQFQYLTLEAKICEEESTPIAHWPQSRWYITRPSDTLEIWDLETGQIIQRFPLDRDETKHAGERLQASDIQSESVFISNGQWLAASYFYPDTTKVWNLETRKYVAVYENLEFGHAAFSSDGTIMAHHTLSFRYVYINDSNKNKGRSDIWVNDSVRVTHLSFSPDNRWLACWLEDGNIQLRDVGSLRLVQTLAGCRGPMYSVSFSADGKSVTGRSEDNITAVWDIESGNRVQPPRRLPVPFKVVQRGEFEDFQRWDDDNPQSYIELHGEKFLFLYEDLRYWFPARGNKLTIAYQGTIVTMTCECPSCQENFGQ